MAVLAFLNSKDVAPPQRIAAHRGNAWLAEHRDGSGTWHSTQATVLALKALLAGTSHPAANQVDRHIKIAVDGTTVQEISIPEWQSDVVEQINLSEHLKDATHDLQLTSRGPAAPGYQVVFIYHLPERQFDDSGPLSIDLVYDRPEMEIGETVFAMASIKNQTDEPLPMVVLDLPIPAGFAADEADFRDLVTQQKIAKFQMTPSNVIVYLRSLSPDVSLRLRYRLQANLLIETTTVPAVAYDYYSPDNAAISQPTILRVADDG